nr:MAG TPA: hypothetical protein [Caudoviricetes sp.]
MPWGRQKKSPNLVNIISPTFTNKAHSPVVGGRIPLPGLCVFIMNNKCK